MITCSIFLFSNCKDAFCFLFVYVVRCIPRGVYFVNYLQNPDNKIPGKLPVESRLQLKDGLNESKKKTFFEI